MDVQTVDVAEAAKALQISPDAVRARIRRGTLAATLDEQGRYQITLPVGAGATPSATVADVTAELVATLRQQLAQAAEREGRLLDQLDLAQRTIASYQPRLPAPRDQGGILDAIRRWVRG